MAGVETIWQLHTLTMINSWYYDGFFFACCHYCFYRHGRAIKSGSGGVYTQDIAMKAKTMDTEEEGGSISEEDENKESAL